MTERAVSHLTMLNLAPSTRKNVSEEQREELECVPFR